MVQQEAERKRVIDAVLTLGEPERSAILFRYYDKLSLREIAERTGVAEKTVQRRINRSLHKLGRQLDKAHGGDGRAWKLAIAPIAGISLSKVAAAESAFIAASLAAKGVGVGAWLAGAAALILVVGATFAVLHMVQPDPPEDKIDHSLTEGDDGTGQGPVRSGGAAGGPSDSGGSNGLNDTGKRVRVPLRSELLPFSMTVVDLVDPDRAVSSYALTLKQKGGEFYKIEEDVNDPEGYFAASLPSGGIYKLKIRSPSYRAFDINEIFVSPTEGLPDLVISLDPGVTITGRIVDAEGTALEGVIIAPVSLLDRHFFAEIENGKTWGKTETDSSGYFELDGLSLNKNRVDLVAFHPDYVPEFFFASPLDHDIEIELVGGYKVSGLIKDDDGNPCGEVSMLTFEKSGASLVRPVFVNENGSYETSAMGPGRIRLEVSSRESNGSFSPESQYVFIEDHDLENVNFGPSSEFCTLSGLLQTGSGFCETDTEIVLRALSADQAQTLFRSTCDQSGHYAFRKIPVGDYDISVEFPSGQMMEGVCTIQFNQPGGYTEDILVEGGSVTGRIDNLIPNTDLSHSFVCLFRDDEPQTSVTIALDSDDHFHFVNVPPGEYSIECELLLIGTDSVPERLIFPVLDETGQERRINVVAGGSIELNVHTPSRSFLRVEATGFSLGDTQYFKASIFDLDGQYTASLHTRYSSDGHCSASSRLPPGKRIVEVAFRNIGYVRREVTLIENQNTVIEIDRHELTPYEWLKTASGTVLYENGQPGAGKTLKFVCTETDGTEERYSYTLSTLVDSNGSYVMPGLYPGIWVAKLEKSRNSICRGDYQFCYISSFEIKESDPEIFTRNLFIPTGVIEATLIDDVTSLPINQEDARWTARIFSENQLVAGADRRNSNKLEVSEIPAGTHRLHLKVWGYKIKESVFFISGGERFPLGELRLEPED